MQNPELTDDDFNNIVFYGSIEDYRKALREVDSPHTQTRNTCESDEPEEPDVTTQHGPRKIVMKIQQENIAVEQLLSTDTQIIYSYKQQLKTTIAYVNCGQIQIIKNTSPNFTCANVKGRDLNDVNNAQHKYYQCGTCKKFFFQISEYKDHLVNVGVDICSICGKRFRDYGKYLTHCLGHGNPERECSGCHKILANKYNLKKHWLICKKRSTLRNVRNPRWETVPKTASN